MVLGGSVAHPCARRLLLHSLTTCAAASLEQLRPLLVLQPQGSRVHAAAFSSLSGGATAAGEGGAAAAAEHHHPGIKQQQQQQQQQQAALEWGAAHQPSSSGRRGHARAGLLAAAAERLQAAPDTPMDPLAALAASGIAYKPHPLPPGFAPGEQQAAVLAKATEVIHRLRSRGYSAYIVGGWVRDVYLGRTAADVDIATGATPAEVRSLFVGDRVLLLPRSTVKLTYKGEVLELSCFKGISRTSNLFSVGLDAMHRDFTLNALYYDPAASQVLDFVGGVADAQSRTLRLTADSEARLTEDPLRVMRGVRFASVLGLKLAPGTARALKQHAHLCSTTAGVPPRRIWLELRKLAAAEARSPGSWPKALKLCYHLGLLPHVFPWMQHTQAEQHAAPDAATAADTLPGSSTDGGSKAVVVAERLSRLLQQQQDKGDSSSGGSPAISLALLVAATVHPSRADYAKAEPHLALLFPDPSDAHDMQVLHTAAQLAAGASSSSSSSSKASSSSDDAWAAFYAQPQARVCLMILASWMPESLSASFRRYHEGRMAQLPDLTQHHRQQQLHPVPDVRRVGPAFVAPAVAGMSPAAATSAGAAAAAASTARVRAKWPPGELAAAIHALVGEQAAADDAVDPGLMSEAAQAEGGEGDEEVDDETAAADAAA